MLPSRSISSRRAADLPPPLRVASGIWIKINRKYDPPKQPRATSAQGDEAKESLLLRSENEAATAETIGVETAPPVPSSRYKQSELTAYGTRLPGRRES